MKIIVLLCLVAVVAARSPPKFAYRDEEDSYKMQVDQKASSETRFRCEFSASVTDNSESPRLQAELTSSDPNVVFRCKLFVPSNSADISNRKSFELSDIDSKPQQVDVVKNAGLETISPNVKDTDRFTGPDGIEYVTEKPQSSDKPEDLPGPVGIPAGQGAVSAVLASCLG